MFSSPPFVPGLALAERLYMEAVRPLMGRFAPDLPYAAGLIGSGSDVLGLDTERSMDHDWGPRLTIFLADDHLSSWRERLDGVLRKYLPPSVAGFPTGFREFADDQGTWHMDDAATSGPIEHRVAITSVSAFLRHRLGVANSERLDASTWITMPEHHLLEVTAGRIFHDGCGEITRVRKDLAWYPDAIWRYRMAAGWMRIGQLEPFIGRCGEVGDDLGSQIVATALARDVIRLAFLLERRYAPYAKWLGTVFASLPISSALVPHLDAARYVRAWPEREAGIVSAVRVLAERHNTLGLTVPLDPSPRPFWSRPFQVMNAERFSQALLASITDPAVLALPRNLGGVDQFMDSTDALENGDLHLALRRWIEDGAA